MDRKRNAKDKKAMVKITCHGCGNERVVEGSLCVEMRVVYARCPTCKDEAVIAVNDEVMGMFRERP